MRGFLFFYTGAFLLMCFVSAFIDYGYYERMKG